jgi:hypothetical protein
MKLTIIPDDKSIGIDGNFLLKIQQDMSWIPEDIHAVQWYGDRGYIEYRDDSPNLEITELGIFHQAIVDYNDELKRIEEEEELKKLQEELSRDYWEEFRSIRDYLLNRTDWTQIPDNNLSTEQKELWMDYRQKLRDLPDKIEDPKPLVLDLNHTDWPIPPESIN